MKGKLKKYKIGYLIGRFQPFHKGHLHLLRRSLKDVERLVIGIGSIGIADFNNPFTFEERKTMLELVIEKEIISDKVIKIVPLMDFHNDKLWLENSLNKSGPIDVVIGNNEWTNGIFERAGYSILNYGFFKRYLYEGIKIRTLMKENKSWEKRIPEYLIHLCGEGGI